eukprot:912658-Pleurochrysis_carterae.AAC.1
MALRAAYVSIFPFCGCGAGFLVDRIDGVAVDNEGENNTLHVAKQSRALGGNTGYFSGDVLSSVIIVLKNLKFDVVWLSCETPNLASVFSPAVFDYMAHVAGEDHQVHSNASTLKHTRGCWLPCLRSRMPDRTTGLSLLSEQGRGGALTRLAYLTEPKLGTFSSSYAHIPKYATDAVESYANAHHRSEASVPGGGTSVKESTLQGTARVAKLFKRWRSRPYMTASEAEKDKTETAKAAEAKKAANVAKKKAADAEKAAAAQQKKEDENARNTKASTAA